MRAVPLPLRPARALCVGAHPDDVEFFAGGTAVGLAQAGTEVTLVVCTDGSRGGRGLEDASQVRRAEQEAAASHLGVREVVRLAHTDGELAASDELRAQLAREIRRVRPELVLGHDPRTLWQTFGERAHLGHSDHRAAGRGLLDAIYPRAGSPNFYLDQLQGGLEPWFPAELWLFDTAEPDLRVDVSAHFERKLSALQAHHSQRASAGGLLRAARGAARHHAGGDGLAEAFVRLRLPWG